ncbi:MAG: cytochrome c biogenesis heme-transporting ATPase CcmA [Proteobacteria bacterium]|nr:cytochrome c biogenesis heme-transporting ATPase CcmA [Pseudomonadota bacterium]NOG59322.1 cytochrome c biogenesis heme-transporting ATPase CcmA [Pseudomonadota bacterium]
MALFKVNNLQCVRRDNILFQGLSFKLEDGGLLQIDGVNGSGKSSLLQMCIGLIQITEGNISWNQTDIRDCRYQFQTDMTYFGHTNGVKTGLTALENMKVMHALSGFKSEVDYSLILKQIGLAGMDDVLLSRMSAGQKRRVGLTRIFMASSKLWLLDEPFNALDKNGKKIIEQLIVSHCKAGGMVIFATHQTMEIDGYPLQHIHLG